MGLWDGIFKSDILGVERMRFTVHDIEEGRTKNVFIGAYDKGSSLHSGLPPSDAVTFGMCEMIGELQQEVSDLRSQLNTIRKNI